jgi:hypothetical protein
MPNPILPTVIFFDLGDTLIFGAPTQQPYADALDTLQILHERGYRLGLLSDQAVGTTVEQVYTRLRSLGLATYIERGLITISTEIPGNVGKPNRPIFDLALQKAGHPTASNQSIFVTETLGHIEAARSYGWRAILKRNTGACQSSEGECVSGLSGLLSLLSVIANPAGTNLHLAPSARLVDGLWAVPVDIKRITASLTFDGAARNGVGDATLEFTMGVQNGNPIFDLRQTITAAWLDGAPLPVAKLAHHDFGGGPNAQLRVVETLLAAGSTHTLRVTYTLGPPQASTAGSYQPAIAWSSGPRLAFNFGFTDLGAGRYLEAWIPANLIFDQFELVLELRLLNTIVAHTVITNGATTTFGANHWRVSFPARFTALSPLLEVRAGDTLVSATDTTTLPVSGANVTIEACKLASNPNSLATQINNLKPILPIMKIRPALTCMAIVSSHSFMSVGWSMKAGQRRVRGVYGMRPFTVGGQEALSRQANPTLGSTRPGPSTTTMAPPNRCLLTSRIRLSRCARGIRGAVLLPAARIPMVIDFGRAWLRCWA